MIHRWGQTMAVMVVVGCSVAWAQVQQEPTVSGDGSVSITLQPEIMRLRIDLLGKGKDLKEAMAKLKERREAAKKKIIELGAAEKTVEIAPAATAVGKADERRQMQMLMRARMSGRKTSKEAEAKARPVMVSATLTAEWAVKTQDSDEMLIFANELQDKIKAADLAGIKEAEPKTPEEAEEAEESEGEEMSMYEGEQGPKPGEPAFVFVARVPADQIDKATAEAFEKAKAKAARLAKAAGATAGSLRFLSSNQRPDYERMSRQGYAYYGNYYQELIQQSYSPEGDVADEAIGPEPGPVKFRVSVTASFAIK
jgi:uncharacterized protein YggE